jgi:hypothetical protein
MDNRNAARTAIETAPPPALPAGEPVVTPYTPRQADRLGAFRNLLRRIHEQAPHIRERNPLRFGPVRDGQVTETYIALDARFVAVWCRVAEAMYRDEFAADEATRRAALDIVREIRREFDGPDAMSADEASALFARS